MEQGKLCAHSGCSCRVAAGTEGIARYCSDECASGAGCDHVGCDCANASTTRAREADESMDRR
jgi:hypothetical protein